MKIVIFIGILLFFIILSLIVLSMLKVASDYDDASILNT
jgi:hypothetical protein